jgi:hypothetical protein
LLGEAAYRISVGPRTDCGVWVDRSFFLAFRTRPDGLDERKEVIGCESNVAG